MKNFLFGFLILSLAACAEQESDSLIKNSVTPVERRGLFITSGACYTGGVAASVGSGTVALFDPDTGEYLRAIIDYNKFAPGDLPVGMAEYDRETILVAVENTSGRRIDLVKKDGSQVNTFLINSTALNGALRFIHRLIDGSFLISKSTAIERFSSSKARITQGANPFISAPGSSCGTSATLMSSTTILPDGNFLFTHAAASPNNKIGIISSTGYATTANCLSIQAAPITTALPTDSLLHSSGKILVTFGSTTATSNQVMAYDYDPTTTNLTGPVVSYQNTSAVNGPSAITEDPATGQIFIANGNANFNNIEKFDFDSTTKLLTKLEGESFIAPSLHTRCISSMKVMSLPEETP